ncbi:extracellular solute-binding protein [Microbacterium sp.]|uniref:ABC transporter substrate-binding protein n=1 Tax=Microbacterium sp. TaxID=51671 RepID=UPI0028113EFF|nr:extracellular solute-binding protein [Microbacterium sp.]
MKSITRPLTAATIAIASVTALTACQGTASGADGSSPTVIEYAWWGSPEKDAAIFAAIESFEASHPDIKVEGESSPWDGYWDKLATMTAGGDAPDVIHMSERYILEYGDRGALADLETLDALDLAPFDEKIVELGRADDSTLYAIPAGLNSFVLAANLDLFEEAGVELPDDTSWTWDDFYQASEAVSDALGIAGADYGAKVEAFKPWVHQAGETMYNEDGTGPGFSRDTLVSFLEHIQKVGEHGGMTADQVSESAGLPVAASLWATGKLALNWTYSNSLGEQAAVADANMRLMRIPSETGAATDAGMYYRGSEFYSIGASSSSEEQAAAAEFVNFMLNDPAGVEAVGMTMGVPPNTSLVEQISSDLKDVDAHVLEFVTDLEADLTVQTPGPSPVGSGNIQGIFDRDILDLLYGRLTVDEAADKMMTAIDDELG